MARTLAFTVGMTETNYKLKGAIRVLAHNVGIVETNDRVRSMIRILSEMVMFGKRRIKDFLEKVLI